MKLDMRHAARSQLVSAVVLLASLACAAHRAPAVRVVHASRGAAVYAAMLDSVTTRPAPDTLLMHDSTAVFVPRRQTWSSPWRTRYDALPAALLEQLAMISHTRRPTKELSLPRPIRTITQGEIREIFARGLVDAWTEIDRRYPNQRNILGFSPIAFSADSADAVVYYTYSCGAECGGSEVVWLSQAEGGGAWRVRAKVPVGSIL